MLSTFIRSAGRKFPVLLLDKLTRFLGLCRRTGRAAKETLSRPENGTVASQSWNIETERVSASGVISAS